MDGTTIEDTGLQAVSCSGQVIGDGVKELTILPWGTVKSKKGTFIVDDEACAAIVTAFDGHGVSVPVDFEHESEEKKGRADAIGWIEKLYAAPGIGLKALIRWTDTARKAIRSDAYRYFSPVLLVRKSDRRAVELHSAALTNLPAIPATERVAASTREPQEMERVTMADDDQETVSDAHVLMGKILAVLGVEEAPGDLRECLLAIYDKIKDRGGADADAQVAASVRELLALPPDANRAAVVLAMRTRDTTGATAELVKMRETEAERLARQKVDGYVKALKLAENDRPAMEAALELARTQPHLLDQLMANAASPLPPQGRTKPPPRGSESRTHTILAARSEYQGDPEVKKGCSMEAFVNLSLRERGMATMSKDEVHEYVVA